MIRDGLLPIGPDDVVVPAGASVFACASAALARIASLLGSKLEECEANRRGGLEVASAKAHAFLDTTLAEQEG